MYISSWYYLKMGSYFTRKREWVQKQDCCGGTVVSTPSNSRPGSPSQRSVSPPQTSYTYCGNVSCGSLAEKETIHSWKEARIGNKQVYYFCSDECWKEWLSSPAHLGSWSSPLSFSTITPPSIEGTSPPADIPMLYI